MGTSKLDGVINSFLVKTDKYTPQILTGLGVVGMIKTAKMAYDAGPKGKTIMEAKKQDLKDCDPRDKEAKMAVYGEAVKEMVPVIGPVIAMGAVTSACIIGSDRASSKRIAALSAAYSVTEAAFKDYKEKTVEMLGEKKAQNIREKISKDKVAKNPPTEQDMAQNNGNVYTIVGDNTCLCMDSYSGRYFHSNAQRIGSAINKLSSDIQSEMYISLNEFWDELNSPELPRTKMGDDLGWNIDDCTKGRLPISLNAVLTPDDQPCLCVDYDVSLRADFRNLH
jgi:hypothetical protein